MPATPRLALALPLGAALGALCGLIGVALLGVLAIIADVVLQASLDLTLADLGTIASQSRLLIAGAFLAGLAVGAATGLAGTATAVAGARIAVAARHPRLRVLVSWACGSLGVFAALAVAGDAVLPLPVAVMWVALLPAVASGGVVASAVALAARLEPVFAGQGQWRVRAASWSISGSAALAAIVTIGTIDLSFNTGGGDILDPACHDLTSGSSWGARTFPPRTLCSDAGSTLYSTVPPTLDTALVVLTVIGGAALLVGLALLVWHGFRTRRRREAAAPRAPRDAASVTRHPLSAGILIGAALAVIVAAALPTGGVASAVTAARRTVPEFTAIGTTSDLIPPSVRARVGLPGAASGAAPTSPAEPTAPTPAPTPPPAPAITPAPVSAAQLRTGMAQLVTATVAAIGPGAGAVASQDSSAPARTTPSFGACAGGVMGSWTAFVPAPAQPGAGQSLSSAVIAAWTRLGYVSGGTALGTPHYVPSRPGLAASDLVISTSEDGTLVSVTSLCSVG